MFRIGQSSDIHQLAEGRRLVLGGVEIEHTKGLVGHSDADALLHAIAEAVIGALGEGDLGKHFPDTDPQYKGISSLILLEQVTELMESKGYRIGNVDALIMIERPKMAPHIPLCVKTSHRRCIARRIRSTSRRRAGRSSVLSAGKKACWPRPSFCWRKRKHE